MSILDKSEVELEQEVGCYGKLIELREEQCATCILRARCLVRFATHTMPEHSARAYQRTPEQVDPDSFAALLEHSDAEMVRYALLVRKNPKIGLPVVQGRTLVPPQVEMPARAPIAQAPAPVRRAPPAETVPVAAAPAVPAAPVEQEASAEPKRRGRPRKAPEDKKQTRGAVAQEAVERAREEADAAVSAAEMEPELYKVLRPVAEKWSRGELEGVPQNDVIAVARAEGFPPPERELSQPHVQHAARIVLSEPNSLYPDRLRYIAEYLYKAGRITPMTPEELGRVTDAARGPLAQAAQALAPVAVKQPPAAEEEMPRLPAAVKQAAEDPAEETSELEPEETAQQVPPSVVVPEAPVAKAAQWAVAAGTIGPQSAPAQTQPTSQLPAPALPPPPPPPPPPAGPGLVWNMNTGDVRREDWGAFPPLFVLDNGVPVYSIECWNHVLNAWLWLVKKATGRPLPQGVVEVTPETIGMLMAGGAPALHSLRRA